jgi:flavodoxin/NAD-dependent dihydropyrimidine dehydrogenase PreA subunit
MKSIVVFCSVTGNTKKIARAIQIGIKEVAPQCEIGSIKEINPSNLISYDLIGIGGPMWGSKGPASFQSFLKKLPDLSEKLCFPFCTHGANPVGFMYIIAPILKDKGLTIIGYNDWYGGVHQLPYMPKPYPTDGHPDEIDLKEAEGFGKQMADLALKISSGQRDLIPDLPEGPDAPMLWQPEPPHKDKHAEAIKLAKKRIKINMEKCTYPKCHVCIDHCPMDSIDFSSNPPVFKRNCIMDFLCEVLCPTGAIELNYEELFGDEPPMPQDHPLIMNLKKAESEGKFRFLVPFDKIGFSTPLCKLAAHPRYVIEE